MHLSRSLIGAGRLARLARTALPVSLYSRAFPAFRAAVACTLLASVTASATACSTRDADAARRDARTGDATARAETAHAPVATDTAGAAAAGARSATPASDGRSNSGVASRTVAAAATDTLLASADVYAGWRTFNVNCQSCHGFNAVASDVAPDLRNSVRQGGTLTRAQFHEVVRTGRMAKGMPAWGALLDAKQIDQIYAYLRARSTGALGAGRPIVGGE
ncbi:MAG TPA: cytochrome c [Gemmatimonadaceae bacterium]|nr:cytochrome c [Gemmatimonadaceae bacterium]